MMYKYLVGGYREPIEKVEITRESDKSVWIKLSDDRERQEKKRSRNGDYHDTWQEAHKDLLDLARRKIERSIQSIKDARDELNEIINLKEPV